MCSFMRKGVPLENLMHQRKKRQGQGCLPAEVQHKEDSHAEQLVSGDDHMYISATIDYSMQGR